MGIKVGLKSIQRDGIFLEDSKHFRQEGYRIYWELFKEALKEELDQS